MSRASGGHPVVGNGTPEQVHLTWGDDPATSVVVSWASPGRAMRPRVRIGQRVILAREQAYTDGATGKTAWTYHARVPMLRPGATYAYAVTADNDANSADPFASTFRTAPTGRAPFRFTCSGDLSVPDFAGAAYAAGAVESFQPLFHLVNGGLCNTGGTFRNFGNGSQLSAASRPWMPVPGAHGPGRQAAYLARYGLPPAGRPDSGERWYSFRVGTVVIACLDSGDLGTGGDLQTQWLERTLARARADATVDWIIVQVHHAACSRSAAGSFFPVRSQWLPLFDRYQVDLVLAGHGSGYERSFPCRGVDLLAGRLADTGDVADTRRPRPVTQADSGIIDTSQGTVHLVLGNHDGTGTAESSSDGTGNSSGSLGDGSGSLSGGVGSGGSLDGSGSLSGGIGSGGSGSPPAGTAWVRVGPGVAVEDATWSARHDPAGGYGIAVFDVHPGTEAGDQTAITASYYRAVPGVGDDLTVLDRFTLLRPRAGRSRRHEDSPAATRT